MLTEHDITRFPYPYAAGAFNRVIRCGVLHFFADLSALFTEVKRLLAPGGTFSFSIAPTDAEEDFIKLPAAWEVPIFRHAGSYLNRLLAANSMSLLKEQRLLVRDADKHRYDMEFSVVVCKYNKL